MAIRNKKQVKQARNVGTIWTIFAYIGALSLGWIGIAIFGPNNLADREYVMPAVILKIFPPAIAAILISGAIAAMTSTANSLLILSSTELSENIINPLMKKKNKNSNKVLFRSRMITALLAAIALILAYVLSSQLIFTLVSYVWAGIGGTFSVVILLSLFWKKYHGKAALFTIIAGMLFTIIWITTGMEEIITTRILTFFVAGTVAVVTTYAFPAKEKKSD